MREKTQLEYNKMPASREYNVNQRGKICKGRITVVHIISKENWLISSQRKMVVT